MNANTIQLVQERVESMMERYWNEYNDTVQDRANTVMAIAIHLFLRKRGWSVLCGNGDWHFYDENGHIVDRYDERGPIGTDLLFKAIVELMNIEIPGVPSDSLGTIMEVPRDVLPRKVIWNTTK